jgi:hypothetical protein
LTGLFLTIIAIPEQMLANSHFSKKTEINANHHNLVKAIINENLVADIVDNEITDEDSYHQFFWATLKVDSYRFGYLLPKQEAIDFDKFQVPFHKFPHLFILFHCWKYLCL